VIWSVFHLEGKGMNFHTSGMSITFPERPTAYKHPTEVAEKKKVEIKYMSGQGREDTRGST
jgi:hypothetical protein